MVSRLVALHTWEAGISLRFIPAYELPETPPAPPLDQPSEWEQRIAELDVDNLSPRAALEQLYAWQRLLKK